MPFSDNPPIAIYPDTHMGMVQMQQEGTAQYPHAFCAEFELDPDSTSEVGHGEWCANRELYGDRAHNWCWKCPAGFRQWMHSKDTIDPYSEDTRERAHVLSW